MKKIAFSVMFFLYLAKFCDAQEKGLKVYKFENKALINMLCSVDTTILRSNDQLAVRIFKVSNGSESAHLEGTDEVSHNFLVAVSSIDEVPDMRLYSVGSFLDPKVVSFKEKNSTEFILVIETGVKDHRKTIRITVSLDKITVN